MSIPAFLKNKQNITIILHVVIWGALLAIPYLLNANDIPRFSVLVKRSWLPIGFSAIIFYLNYFVLVDRLLFSKKEGAFLIANITLVVLVFWLNIYVKTFFPPTYNSTATDPDNVGRLARIRELARYSSLISFVLSVVLSVALKMTGRWIRIEAEKEKAEKMRLEAELLHLRYQLQPHFFFNSLNNIYALIDKSPVEARKAVHGLGKLMRYLLYETNSEKMSLATEIEFLIRYIQLMGLRLTQNIQVEYDFPKDGTNYQVAPLLFIPLIENAFKHGVPARDSAAIYFKMEVNKHQLSFTSRNENIPKDGADKSGSGIGLVNLRKRLELLYPHKHRFTAGVVDKHYVTSLLLDFS